VGEGDGAPLMRHRCSDGRIGSTWRIVAALAERGDAVGDRVYKARFDGPVIARSEATRRSKRHGALYVPLDRFAYARDDVSVRLFRLAFARYRLAMILIGAPRIVSGNETTEPTPLIVVWPTSLAW
jgi:hypothetical protein